MHGIFSKWPFEGHRKKNWRMVFRHVDQLYNAQNKVSRLSVNADTFIYILYNIISLLHYTGVQLQNRHF